MSRWWRGRPRVSRGGVVHPGVVVGAVPPADQQQLLARRCASSPSTCAAAGAGRRARGRGASWIFFPGVCSRSGMVGRSGPRSTPSGCARSSRIVVRRPERRSAGHERASDWPRAWPAARSSFRATACACQPGGDPQRELAVDLPVVHARPSGFGSTAGREARGVADRERVEDEVVVVALERGRRRQDHVGVPGGLVEVDVDRDHEVEPVERLAEPRAVGRRQHRVAGQREQRADLALARRLDLLAQHADRQLAAELREAAHPAAPRVQVAAPDEPRPTMSTAGSVNSTPPSRSKLPVSDVEAVDRPLADRAERLGRQAHPAVAAAAVGRRELAGEARGSRRRPGPTPRRPAPA